MAIQNRRGQYRHFDPSKMVAGEWAVVQTGDPNASNGEAVYMAFEPGQVKRMATYEDMVDQLEDAVDEAVVTATATATAAATTATEQAVLAESYAKGGTNTRTGENTDNAKYYNEQSTNAAISAAASVVSAQNAQTAAEAARDRAEAAADTAVAASGVNLYSIAESPDTNGLALYYIEGDE